MRAYIALALLLPLTVFASQKDEYSYIALSTNPDMNSSELVFTIAPAAGEVFDGFGLSRGVTFCSPEDDRICFMSHTRWFAVPKVRQLAGERWEYGGSEFVAEKDHEYTLFGENYRLFRIVERKNGKVRSVSYYSCRHGLLAFTERDSQSEFFFGLYVSQADTGYGAWCR